MPAGAGLDREGWRAKLRLLGQALEKHGRHLRVEIIGAWPLIEAGMPSRSTMDLDLWAPHSQLDFEALAAACASAEIAFDPVDEVSGPYLQVVRPGIVGVPDHSPVLLGQWGGLVVETPPPGALAVAKLIRASNQDIADVFFLCAKYALRPADVRKYVKRLPDHRHRAIVRENLVYLEAGR